MFLDIFPMHEQETRPMRPVREPVAETGKSRSAWPFIVAGKVGGAHAAWNPPLGTPAAPAAVLVAPGASSFVT